MLFKIKQLPLLLFALLVVFAALIASATEREGRQGREGEREKQREEQEDNPYIFEDQHFSTPFKSQHGRIRILRRFTERSELLRGIENYRLSIFEAEPQTFILPSHWDAEVISFVLNGRGSASWIREEKRESFNFRRGDIVRIPAGTTTYLINSDDNEKLIIANLIQPVSTPGHFEAFYGAGGENPESYYKVFSNDILKAAFSWEDFESEKFFGQQKQGVFIKASKEQIRALSLNEESGKTERTINIFQERPSLENQYGRLHRVRPEDHRQLQHLDIGVYYLNITQKLITVNLVVWGGLSGPTYDSKATRIAVVVKGEGYFEMASPDLSSQSGKSQGHEGSQEQSRSGNIRYQKVSAHLKHGTVVVIPAGYPIATVASNNQNIELLVFSVNARHNQRVPLAGRKNVVNYFHKEAKELAFGVPLREVDQVFNSQQQEDFFKGPSKQHEGRADE